MTREYTNYHSQLECYSRVHLETAMNSMLNVHTHISLSYHVIYHVMYIESDIETILNWTESSEQDLEIPFKPARVLLQDFTYKLFHL